MSDKSTINTNRLIDGTETIQNVKDVLVFLSDGIHGYSQSPGAWRQGTPSEADSQRGMTLILEMCVDALGYVAEGT